MKRSLLSLLFVLGALAACKDTPPGELKPIPRPADYQEPPKAAAPKPPPVDPNKVTLRWKIAEGAPMALRLEGTPGAATLYVLEHPKGGDLTVRLAQEGAKAPQDQGTFSERGFVLDGLGPVDRNLSTLMLELPKDPVGVGSTWLLSMELLSIEPMGRQFLEKKAERHNTAKLTSLVPAGEDRVATIEYDVKERVEGVFARGPAEEDEHEETAPVKAPKGKGKGKEAPKPEPKDKSKSAAANPVSVEVTFTGHGDFLVNAGRWRSWEGTLSTKTEGYTPAAADKSPAQVPPGTLKLKLTALDSVPSELQLPPAKK